MSGDIEVRLITAAETLPLRMAVLRPNRPDEAARFPEDEDATTRHFGAFRDGKLSGIATLLRVEMPGQPGVPALQLRGMATAPEVRGEGFGRALVLACLAFARDDGVPLLWCNARTGAVGFYRKLGFEIVGAEFIVPDVGPHFRMWVRLDRTG
jgi:GNAT superfamily N-acetyltransferase